jgi:hypothetical protein
LAVAAFALTVSGVLLGQSEPFNGTWKLNVAKSKFPPSLTLKGDSRTYESSRDGIKVSAERFTGDGSTQSYAISAKYDGKDYPITGQGPFGADTISHKKLSDPSTTVATLKKSGGKLNFTTTTTVSKDGKVLTLMSKGTDASGQPFNVALVYDKQ